MYEGKLSPLEQFVQSQPEAKNLSKEIVEQIVREILDELPKHGWNLVSDVNELYRTQRGELLVRRESPQRLLDAVLHHRDLHLSFGASFGPTYLNSAIWTSHKPETMRWAMQEGFSTAGGLSVVEVIDPGVSDVTIETIETAVPSITMPTGEIIDRSLYRATSGSVRPEDLRFIVVATVAQRFPVDQMTQDESERFDEWQQEMTAFEEAKKQGQRMKQPNPFNIVRAYVPDRAKILEERFMQAE